ncbi:MAG TPA: SelB C-terminal domain-containing protein, partial [Thermomicrobiaceae bacterium]|nr:SelB C-terminal domain-containing protein [Thermomicrobiaceae bacterium]
PGWLTPTRLLDARVRLVPDSPVPLEQNDEVDLFIGSAETTARVTLLDAERLDPGLEGWLQLRFPEPLVAVKGDRFILRRPSPSLTIGGGAVVDPHPRRHRRFRSDVVAALDVLATGTPEEIVVQALGDAPLELRSLLRAVALPESSVREALTALTAEGRVVTLRRGGETASASLAPSDYVARVAVVTRATEQIGASLATYHERNPLRRGMAREEIRSRLGWPARPFEELVARAVAAGLIADDGETLRLAEFQIRFTPDQRARIDRYLAALRAAPHTPPAPAEFGIEPELAIALAETGEVVRVDASIVFPADTFQDIEQQVLAVIDRDGRITLAQFRDHFGSSRKYAQAVLEFLDQRRVTRRVGDERVRYSGG